MSQQSSRTRARLRHEQGMMGGNCPRLFEPQIDERPQLMAKVTWHRSKRADPPPMPRGDLLLESPPEVPVPQGSKPFSTALRVLPMLAGGGAMALMMTQGGGRGPIGPIIGVMYGVSMIGMMASTTGRSNDDQAAQLDASRRDYFRYLAQIRRKVRKAADQQRRAINWRHPNPELLWSVVGSKRMWERRTESEDFLSVRIAEGPQQFARRITPPDSKPIEDLEPLTTGALRRFIRTHRSVAKVPLALSLRSFATVSLVGELEAERRLAYAMLAQVATWHAPTDCRIVFCVAKENMAMWEWAKWLPHAQHPSRVDGAGPVRLFTHSTSELAAVTDGLRGLADDGVGHVVLVVDGVAGVTPAMLSNPQTQVTMIDITQMTERPRRVDPEVAVLEISAGKLTLHRRDASAKTARTPLGTADQLPATSAESLARGLAGYVMPKQTIDTSDSDDVEDEVVFEAPKDYPAMLGQADPMNFDFRTNWKLRPMHQRLRVPFGNAANGRPVELDIKESALGGMGPHGICIGATGSGKSEFLRTLVLGLAMTHSSEYLNFVLVDFKGGATFLGLDQLPHVSAVITNLEGELTLVDRMQDAIAGELERRMELLRAAGNFKNREDYEQARLAGADLPPMPSLFIVVDEFSELLQARPDFIELFIQIGRIGRSVAVHQLLASQRLEESKLRGLDTFLSYRIALRTFSAAESRVVIGVPDAYELPPGPGNGYLKQQGDANLVQFKAAYVSGPWQGSSSAAGSASSSAGGMLAASALQARPWVPPVLPFEASFVAPVEPPPEPESDEVAVVSPNEGEEDLDDETLINVVVNKLQGQGAPAHQVWLPPLDEPPTLNQLLTKEFVVHPQRGLTTPDPAYHHTLQAAVALIDRPRQQRRDPMWLDFSGSGGHMAIVGGPQSGKSTAARTTIASLALTHTPDEVGFYCLDFGGGSLASLRGLPHVGSVCSRLDVDRVRRTIAELTSLMQAREVAFAELGVDSMATYRRGRRDGSIPRDRFPTDVFLVVDGWATLRSEFEEQEAVLTALAGRGLGFGIHLMGSANKWSEFRTTIRDLLQSRIELKLGDPFDSEIDRRTQPLIPADRPGRGISTDRLHMLTGLPRIDSIDSADDLSVGVRSMVDAVRSAWPGAKAAEVRLLPDLLPISALPAITQDDHDRRIPLGIDELELATFYWDPTVDSHFITFGAPECGKSSLIRTFLRGITTRYTEKQARIMLLDYRRAHLGYVEGGHLLGYAASHEAANELMKGAAAALKARVPGPKVTQQQLRDRSWWKGSELFVVVDDYELVATSIGNPLQELAPYVSQALDIGLHIIIARGMGGASRTAYGDQVVARMKDAVNPGLIMSGTRDEGALLSDVKAYPLPPGRGTLVNRNGKVLVQTAWTPPADS